MPTAYLQGVEAKRHQQRQALDRNAQGSRKRGRPKTTWRRCLQKEIDECRQLWSEIKMIAKNISKWKCFIESLCSSGRYRKWWWWLLQLRFLLNLSVWGKTTCSLWCSFNVGEEFMEYMVHTYMRYKLGF